jgi:prepilin-type processing-associated H-X9-DG protein
VGDADRGQDLRQPGGWIYNILPYIEMKSVHDLDRGTQGQPKIDLLIQRDTTPIETFVCPTRRACFAYPNSYLTIYTTKNGFSSPMQAKTDYAANAGDPPRAENPYQYGGPDSLADGDKPDFPWPDAAPFNGVIFLRSCIKPVEITDGSSHTYLLGEKNVEPRVYHGGQSHGDDWSMYTGWQDDIGRTTFSPPVRDRHNEANDDAFGSAHSHGCNFVFCDGSVHCIGYDIDPETHDHLGNRKDGIAIDESALR